MTQSRRSTGSPTRIVGVVLSGVAVCLLASAIPATAAISAVDAHCRKQIALGTRKLAEALIRERAACQRLRLQGSLGSQIDCNDPASAPASPKIYRAAQRLLSLTQAACVDAPASNGFVYCPPPCGPQPIGTYTQVAQCLSCLTQGQAQNAVDDAFGNPPAPGTAAAQSCHSRVAQGVLRYLRTRMREQQLCQTAQDRSTTAVNCLTADQRGKIADAAARLDDDAAACTGAALQALSSCAVDLAGEKACLQALTEGTADTLFAAVYRPPTPPPTPTNTPLPLDTETPTETTTPVASNTPPPTPTNTPGPPTSTPTNLPPIHVDIEQLPPQTNLPCLIFVHGKRTNSGTYTDWNQARDYWINGSDDFVRTATRNFAASYYVVGYNGTQAYWDTQSAGEVATEIVNATNGGADGGGHHCARTYADGGTFWVVAHSMGPSVVDFILGNADPSDPNYNLNGPYDVAAQRLSLAISIAGTHRGSQGADLVCGEGNPFCSFFAQFVQSCDDATYWIRSSDDVQVRTWAGAPARTVWLTSGYAAIIGASLCLSGEDDGLVQHASSYACNGSATAGYSNDDVCNNANKMKPTGFKNLDTAHENHDQERNDSESDTRVAIPGGIWICNGAPCSPGAAVQGSMSTSRLVSTLY